MLYNIILFLHIMGAILMFVAVGITLTAMILMIRSKRVETMQTWAKLAVKVDGLLPLSVLFILLPGLYLVITTWGWGQAWINISLLTLVIMTIMGPVINLRRLKNILNAVNAEEANTGAPSLDLLNQAKDRTLWNSVNIMTMLAVGIVFLMTVKVGLFGSIATIIVSVLLGLIMSKSFLRVKSGVENNSLKRTGL